MNNVPLPKYSERLAELVGILLGDGHISQYQVSIALNSVADSEYVSYVENLIKAVFPTLRIQKSKKSHENLLRIYINSVQASEYFKNMGITSGKPLIPTWIFSKRKYQVACMRGLIDTEGSVAISSKMTLTGVSNYKQIIFTNLNPVLQSFVKNTLTMLEIKCSEKIAKNIYISSRRSILEFVDLVGFSNPKLGEKARIIGYNNFADWRVGRTVMR